ncbi:MAG: hypothetical protein CME17_03965 [Gemmatimonadetes bacterium]|nr:hypothetical protein [Gemmatimonadota bacterium]
MNKFAFAATMAVLLFLPACATTSQTRLQFTVEECIRACAPLAQNGFKPIWDTNGSCICVLGIAPKTDRRRPKKTFINNL